MEFNITENKYRFEALLREIVREGADIPSLLYKLEQSDFYFAPCSTKFHLSVPGGLCQHSLNVFDMCIKLNETLQLNIDRESIIIAALLHDLDKMNKYEEYVKNVKKYHDGGKKSDDMGKFDWVAEKAYGTKEAKDRFVYGHHGQNSEYIANSYIPLKLEESAAITNHMGGMFDEYRPWDQSVIFERYPLSILLHSADALCTFIWEKE
jgi:HD superfamily phosphodiesterase